jgi:hypothetical protein
MARDDTVAGVQARCFRRRINRAVNVAFGSAGPQDPYPFGRIDSMVRALLPAHEYKEFVRKWDRLHSVAWFVSRNEACRVLEERGKRSKRRRRRAT